MRPLRSKPERASQQTSSHDAASSSAKRPAEQPASPAEKLQRAIGNQAVLRLLRAASDGGNAGPGDSAGGSGSSKPAPAKPPLIIQAKLAVNSPGDIYEQEADHIAEQVIGMAQPRAAAPPASSTAPAVQRKCACGGTCDKCQTNAEQEEVAARPRIQMKSVAAGSAGQKAAPPMVHEVLNSPGRPLDADTRAFMEPRLGHDFGDVRVHADSQAARSAQAVQAQAYTVGRDIVFGASQFAPGTLAGQRLLAHELTHVVQQSGDGKGGQIRRANVARDSLQRTIVSQDERFEEIAKDINAKAWTQPRPYEYIRRRFDDISRRDEDNIGAAFVALQSETKLEQFAASADGRRTLDVLYDAIATGDVSDFQRDQAQRILDAERAPTASLVATDASSDPLDIYAAQIAQELNKNAATHPAPDLYIRDALSDVGKNREDNVAAAFVALQSVPDLEKFAATSHGWAMLGILYQAIITGDVSAFERSQSQRILAVRRKRPPKDREAAEKEFERIESERMMIFPVRNTGLFHLAVAVFNAKLLPSGKVSVKYVSENIFDPMFKEDVQTLLPWRRLTSEPPLELDPERIVGVRLYDDGETLLHVPALALIDIANQSARAAVGKGMTAFMLGLTLGSGALGAGGVRSLAAEVETGKATVATLRALKVAKALLWTDRVAFGIQALAFVLDDFRDKLPSFVVKAIDAANRIGGYYGWGRLGLDGFRFVRSKLSPALIQWRAEMPPERLSPAAKGVQNEIEDVLNDINQAEREAGTQAVNYANEHHLPIKEQAGRRYVELEGGHEIVEVEDKLAKTGIACEFHSPGGPRVPCPRGMGERETQTPESPSTETPSAPAPKKPATPPSPPPAKAAAQPPGAATKPAPKAQTPPKSPAQPADAPPTKLAAPKAKKQGSRELDPKKRIQVAAGKEHLEQELEAQQAAVRGTQGSLQDLESELQKLQAKPKKLPDAIKKDFEKLPPMGKTEEQLEDRLTALRQLKKNLAATNRLNPEVAEYLDWQEEILAHKAEIAGIVEGNRAAGEQMRDVRKVKLPEAEVQLRKASQPIKVLLRKEGRNYRATEKIGHDQIMGEQRWDRRSAAMTKEERAQAGRLSTDHLVPVTEMANRPELTEFLQIYEKAPTETIKDAMIQDLVDLGDMPENLKRMGYDANIKWKNGRSWHDLRYDQTAKELGYELGDFTRMQTVEDGVRARILERMAKLTKKYRDLVAKARGAAATK